MADEQVTRRPQQIVLDLKWTEDGQQRRELFGPWAQDGDPETDEGRMSHLMAAHRFLREWASVNNPDAKAWADLGAATEITPDQRTRLAALLREGTTIPAVARELGVTPWNARCLIERLKTEGLIRKEGDRRRDRDHSGLPGRVAQGALRLGPRRGGSRPRWC